MRWHAGHGPARPCPGRTADRFSGTRRVSGVCTQDECRSYVYDEGTILIDIVDGRTKALIWRGWAERSLEGIVDDQNLMDQTIDRAVSKICARLPVRHLSGGRPYLAQDQ